MVRAKIEENPIVRVVVYTAQYAVKLLAIWVLLRGHHQPGGGFIAGLLISAVLALQGVAFGWEAAQAIFPLPGPYLLGSGLLISFSTVLSPALLGDAFMDHRAGAIRLPLVGDVEWTTALLFDVGVFLVVVGTMKTILLAIAADTARPVTSAAQDAEREV